MKIRLHEVEIIGGKFKGRKLLTTVGVLDAGVVVIPCFDEAGDYIVGVNNCKYTGRTEYGEIDMLRCDEK